ncbi:ubiquitin-protein ligase E3A-like [Tachypleus tridentatus]|uniref:ubiquitin-protein ligase E3A-like n=1 Tax=Tachypleus tridentatus TaxID=6853 RepID=UPI003FD10550
MDSEDSENPSCAIDDTAARKRAAVKKLIEQYYYQLTKGCRNPSCANEFCASSGKVKEFTPDEAAAQALQLFMRKADLCGANPSKMSKLPNQGMSESVSKRFGQYQEDNKNEKSSRTNNHIPYDEDISCDRVHSSVEESPMEIVSPTHPSTSITNPGTEKQHFLSEKILLEIISKCQEEKSYSVLIRTLGEVFSNKESLVKSFLREEGNIVVSENLTKEHIRAMEIDQDKDQDTQETEENVCTTKIGPLKLDDVTLDIESVRRAFLVLFGIPGRPFQDALINALNTLCMNLEIDLKYHNPYHRDKNVINIFLIIMEIPMLECPEYLDSVLPAFCKTVSLLPLPAQTKLARVWSKAKPDKLKTMVDTLHQMITLRVIGGHFSRDYYLNDDVIIVAATKTMKILYYAGLMGGIIESVDYADEIEQTEEDESFQDLLQGAVSRDSKEPKQTKTDPFVQDLGLRVLDCRKPLIPFEDYYNELLSDNLEMDQDFTNYKSGVTKFSFMNFSFILTPAVKAQGLYYDNRIRMFNERRLSVIQSLLHGSPPYPFLRLRVRRDHLVDDALVGLEMVAMENPTNLKKQLVVEFDGEQGVDEGGVSKEFFQLVIEELFNPDFAMFTLNQETETYWFNPTSFESDAQFTLIGIILGLAIYNNVILDVHFPMVLYRKLLGKRGSFHDLYDWNPDLARGLQYLLDYEDSDIEDVFMQSFRITYQDVFGTLLTQDLKENGEKLLVNQVNKQEFVEMYADFLLNRAVEKQFRAFRRGFQMVTEDSPLKELFRPEEVELLVCGSKHFDFSALEEATEYDGGYTVDTPLIRYFWEVFHKFSLDEKRKFLQFATGSDRAPVGGLSKLKLVIARNGSDSDRLPTAHTCFNVLLLPEYTTKEKLRERLLKAINYSKGFGML